MDEGEREKQMVKKKKEAKGRQDEKKTW